VYGYDPVTAAAQRLKRAGGTPLASVTEVAERVDVLITALASHSALAEAVEAIGRSRKRRRLLIEMSTLPLADKRRARKRLARARVIALDCPVSGTAVRLNERTWTIFASGAKAACARAQPVLAVLADNAPYVGTYGNGTRMKLVANHLVAILNVASAETLLFARRMGLNARRVLHVFGPSPIVGTGVMRLRGELMAKRRYRPPTMKVAVVAKGHAHHRRDGARRRRADAAVRRLRADFHRRAAAGLRRGRYGIGLRSAGSQGRQVLTAAAHGA
jgi:putative dehydrogenase